MNYRPQFTHAHGLDGCYFVAGEASRWFVAWRYAGETEWQARHRELTEPQEDHDAAFDLAADMNRDLARCLAAGLTDADLS